MVTDADRQAAARLAAPSSELAAMRLSGKHDGLGYVQAFAAHREAGARAERAVIVEWLRSLSPRLLGMGNYGVAIDIAAAIERGEHQEPGAPRQTHPSNAASNEGP